MFSTDNRFEASMSISLLLQNLPLFTRCFFIEDKNDNTETKAAEEAPTDDSMHEEGTSSSEELTSAAKSAAISTVSPGHGSQPHHADHAAVSAEFETESEKCSDASTALLDETASDNSGVLTPSQKKPKESDISSSTSKEFYTSVHLQAWNHHSESSSTSTEFYHLGSHGTSSSSSPSSLCNSSVSPSIGSSASQNIGLNRSVSSAGECLRFLNCKPGLQKNQFPDSFQLPS